MTNHTLIHPKGQQKLMNLIKRCSEKFQGMFLFQNLFLEEGHLAVETLKEVLDAQTVEVVRQREDVNMDL